MHWRAGKRPRKSWRNCADFWTSTRGEADEQLRELDFTGGFADARVDVGALRMARGGAGGVVCRGARGMPERVGPLCAGRGGACFDDGVADRNVYLVTRAGESGRSEWGRRSCGVGGNVHPKRDRAVKLPRPGCRISSGTSDGYAVAGGSVVPGRSSAESENRWRFVPDRKNAPQRDPAGGSGAVREMPGVAAENGSRPRHPVLRVPSAGRCGGAGVVPSGGAAASAGADWVERSANRSGDRA